jgi:hypothetical protein
MSMTRTEAMAFSAKGSQVDQRVVSELPALNVVNVCRGHGEFRATVYTLVVIPRQNLQADCIPDFFRGSTSRH